MFLDLSFYAMHLILDGFWDALLDILWFVYALFGYSYNFILTNVGLLAATSYLGKAVSI